MKKTNKTIRLLIAGFLVLSFAYGIFCYNSLVKKEERVKTQWGQVENQYQRRSDLIPNLVNTVKGYATHERETLEAVIKARAAATSITMNSDQLSEKDLMAFQKAQDQLSSALNKLMVVVENYPSLKANENFLTLQAQLEGTENRIAVERKRFNEATMLYNKARRQFPTILFAKLLGFKNKDYFDAEESASNSVDIQF